jgi:type IX secretion system PorP/SprF family membrane protein
MTDLLRKILLINLILGSLTVSAQQVPRYSQYIMNEFLINPAVAGYDGRTTLNLAARKELIGFTHKTPQTYSFSAQTRILKRPFSIKSGLLGKTSFKPGSKGRVGVGISFLNDVNTAIHRTGFQFTYAYHIFILNSQLSFGLSGTVFQFKVSDDDFYYKDPNDVVIDGLSKGLIIPDANFGVNFMNQNYHIGIAACQLFKSHFQMGNYTDFNDTNSAPFNRNYYILGAYRYRLFRKPKWELEPSSIIRINNISFKDGFELRYLADLSMKVFYKREYWAGLSFRTSDEVMSINKEIILMLGIKVNKYYFGYSFDYGLNSLSKYSYGSHEITISAKFGDSVRRYRWLERY